MPIPLTESILSTTPSIIDSPGPKQRRISQAVFPSSYVTSLISVRRLQKEEGILFGYETNTERFGVMEVDRGVSVAVRMAYNAHIQVKRNQRTEENRTSVK